MAPQQTTHESTTRQIILQAAFEEIHVSGFQAASLAKILSTTGVTKGALYHYFPNKMALGYAVVEEVITVQIFEQWVEPLSKSNNPITALKQIMYEAGQNITNDDIQSGCPLNNLAQEMAPVDEGFRNRIEHVYKLWRKEIEQALFRRSGRWICEERNKS